MYNVRYGKRQVDTTDHIVATTKSIRAELLHQSANDMKVGSLDG